MTASERLTELGLTLPKVPVPAGAYVPAVVHDGLVWSAGQIPLVDGVVAATGQVAENGPVSPEQAKDLARICALNALAAVDAALEGGLDSVTRVVKVVGFVNSAVGFGGQPGVINGASELLGEVFGDAGKHARSAVGVAALPFDAPVEVEIVVSTR